MSRVMQYHGCRSHLRDRNKVTELEDKFDLLVDANDAILERVVSIVGSCALLLTPHPLKLHPPPATPGLTL